MVRFDNICFSTDHISYMASLGGYIRSKGQSMVSYHKFRGKWSRICNKIKIFGFSDYPSLRHCATPPPAAAIEWPCRKRRGECDHRGHSHVPPPPPPLPACNGCMAGWHRGREREGELLPWAGGRARAPHLAKWKFCPAFTRNFWHACMPPARCTEWPGVG